MKTFYGVVEETLRRVVKIQANDSNEAYEKLEEAYQNEDIVLDYEDFADRTLNIEDNEETIERFSEDDYIQEI